MMERVCAHRVEGASAAHGPSRRERPSTSYRARQARTSDSAPFVSGWRSSRLLAIRRSLPGRTNRPLAPRTPNRMTPSGYHLTENDALCRRRILHRSSLLLVGLTLGLAAMRALLLGPSFATSVLFATSGMFATVPVFLKLGARVVFATPGSRGALAHRRAFGGPLVRSRCHPGVPRARQPPEVVRRAPCSKSGSSGVGPSPRK